MKSNRSRLFIILWAVTFLSFMALFLFFMIKYSDSERRLDQLQQGIDKIQLRDPQDGNDGHTPTEDELRSLIWPLIPSAIPGLMGPKGDSIKGDSGSNGNNGTDAQPCTTFTDENNDSYVSCPDGTQTLIPQPDQPRQIELCSTPTITLGWRYVGSITCLEVEGP